MKIWAVVPIKPINSAKSRLSAVLTAQQRSDLAMDFLNNTLHILSGWKPLAGILIVSADPFVWDIACQFPVDILKEPDVPGLNESLLRGSYEIERRGGEGVLIIPGDLPYLDLKSLQTMLDLAISSPRIIIVPDKHHSGTNAMLMAPNCAIPYCYGPGSFLKHQEAARMAQIPITAVDLAPLALDIDLPEDLLGIQQWLR
jgi:2-phospho-L-lactate guanylyltransferase